MPAHSVIRRCGAVVALTFALVRPLLAQTGLLDDLRGLSSPSPTLDEPVTVAAQFTPPRGDEPARLYITASVAPGWHIYSITQPAGGPIATQLKLDADAHYELAGEFRAVEAPEQHLEEAFKGLLVEEHHGEVTWHVPIRLGAGVDPATLEITGKIRAQACHATGCLPPKDHSFKARLGPGVELPAEQAGGQELAAGAVARRSGHVGSYTNPRSGTVIRGRLEPGAASPGGTAKLVLSAEPAQGWHVYELADKPAALGSQPTLIVLTRTSGLSAGKPRPDRPSQSKGGDELGSYNELVEWTIELEVPRNAEPGAFSIAGLIGYQSCLDESCDRPEALAFEADLPVKFISAPGETPVIFTEIRSYKAAADPGAAAAGTGSAGRSLGAPLNLEGGFDPAKLEIREFGGYQHRSLWIVLALALLGGLILNAMPCVLPVIGLKILSFVEQSSHDRGRVLALNLWYSFGLISVFMVLATLAVFLNLGWGEQFTSSGFNIAMAALVFVMALSFLGVWEIPIPGFVGSGAAAGLAVQEGAGGAFAKGVLTTILATPCSGPFLGPVFGFTLTQPPAVTYAVFFCVGLGMATPYLLVGAFPALIRFLPKPGAWMDTFKHIMGFVLLGTVVFLFNTIDRELFIPALAFLMGLWAAFWWIGRTPLFADFTQKARAWAIGATIATAVGLVAFVVLVPGENVLPWQPYSRDALVRHTADEKTVLIDFTADW